jgi:hypothetical protein
MPWPPRRKARRQERAGSTSMNLMPSRLNEALAASVQSKLAAEKFHISGKSGFWRAIGVGLIGLGSGSAIGLGFYGYSFVTRNDNNLAVLSAAFSKALSEVQLRGSADGTVKFEPHEIALSKGQTITFDPTSRLQLDPSAKVTADGDLRIQIPNISAPPSGSPRARGIVPTITNFTIFKSVPFEKGSVQTGWNFLTSAQRSPTTQYCYYQESGDNPDVSVRIEVGVDQKLQPSKGLSKSFDIAAAFDKCVWFKKDAP